MAIIGLIPVVTIFWIYKGFKRDTLCPLFFLCCHVTEVLGSISCNVCKRDVLSYFHVYSLLDTFCHSLTHSLRFLVSQSVNQSISQSINQSVNQSVIQSQYYLIYIPISLVSFWEGHCLHTIFCHWQSILSLTILHALHNKG